MHPVNESILQLLKDTIFALLNWGGDKYKKHKDKKEAEAKEKKAKKSAAKAQDDQNKIYAGWINSAVGAVNTAIKKVERRLGALEKTLAAITPGATAANPANAKMPETPEVPPTEVRQPASAEKLKTPVNLNKPYVYVAPEEDIQDAVFEDVPRAALPASVPSTVEDLLTGKDSGESPEKKDVNNLGRPLDKNKSPAVLTGTYIPADRQPTPEANTPHKPATITLDKTQYAVKPTQAQAPEQTHVNELLAQLGAAQKANPAEHPQRYKVLGKNAEGFARPPVAPATRNLSLAKAPTPKG